MKRGRESAGRKLGDAAAGFDEVEPPLELETVRYTKATVKVDQIDATPQKNVLAIVDFAGLGMFAGEVIGRSAAAEKWTGFMEVDLESSATEGCSGRQPSETTAGDQDRRHYRLVTAGNSSPVTAATPTTHLNGQIDTDHGPEDQHGVRDAHIGRCFQYGRRCEPAASELLQRS